MLFLRILFLAAKTISYFILLFYYYVSCSNWIGTLQIDIVNICWCINLFGINKKGCFDVKYLGCLEVFDSRGMPVCEEALKKLKTSKKRAIKSILYVNGDGLRVVDFETKGLLLDQTIEKVSFCAPDHNYDRGFSYICRDGTTRRWMCHGFMAIKETVRREKNLNF